MNAKQKGMHYDFLVSRLRQYGYVDENHGIISIDTIREVYLRVLPKYSVSYCYLFGSYAKGNAKNDSDIDLLIHTESTGLKFYELVEELREELKKKVDILNQHQIVNNFNLTNEILQDGIKIFG